jgi:hypothetical protein
VLVCALLAWEVVVRIQHLVVSLLCVSSVGCIKFVTEDDDKDEVQGTTIQTATEQLVKAITFEGGEQVEGLLPESTNEDVSLLSLAADDLTPGADALLVLDVDPPETEPTAALIQFADVPVYFLVDDSGFVDPAAVADGGSTGLDGGAAGPKRVGLSYKVAKDVCDDLCDTTYDIEITQAVKIGKEISKHTRSMLRLDCSDDGDPKRCAKEPTGNSPTAMADAGDVGLGGSTAGSTAGNTTGTKPSVGDGDAGPVPDPSETAGIGGLFGGAGITGGTEAGGTAGIVATAGSGGGTAGGTADAGPAGTCGGAETCQTQMGLNFCGTTAFPVSCATLGAPCGESGGTCQSFPILGMGCLATCTP